MFKTSRVGVLVECTWVSAVVRRVMCLSVLVVLIGNIVGLSLGTCLVNCWCLILRRLMVVVVVAVQRNTPSLHSPSLKYDSQGIAACIRMCFVWFVSVGKARKHCTYKAYNRGCGWLTVAI